MLPTIFFAMDTVPVDDEPAIVVVWSKNKEGKAYEDRWMYEYSSNTGHMLGIFDGHGGSRASNYLAQNLSALIAEQKGSDACLNISNALVAVEKNIKAEAFHDGSTAVVVNVVSNSKNKSTLCHFINTGDSRAVLGHIAPARQYTVSFFTKDHVPSRDDERKRVLQAGGYISSDEYVYANAYSHGLAMTRSIGDRGEDPEKKVIIATPECTTCDISNVSDEGYLVLGSDGLWDYLNQKDDVSEYEFSEYAFSKISSNIAAGNSLVEIGKSMVEDALRKRSTDDITCMLVKIKALTENKKATMQIVEMVSLSPTFISLFPNLRLVGDY